MAYAPQTRHERQRMAPHQRGRDAFEVDLLEQLPHLRNYALSLAQTRTDASELVQDCLLKALEKRHLFAEGTYMRRWLFTILRNQFLDQCRQQSRRGTHIPIDECPSSRLSHPASQDDWVDLRNCQKKLKQLGTCDRSILLLSVFSSLSQKDIAQHLGVAEGTIRSRLSRARTHLKA